MPDGVRTALLFLPGAAFWVLFAVGLATGNDTLLVIATGLMVVIAVTVITMRARAAGAERAERRRIWHEGQPARAKVLALSSGGGALNDHPWVDLDLEVRPEGAAPYRARVHALISRLAIPRIQPACELDVRVDRTDRQRLVVDAALTPYGYD